jgi:hypothetical protein
VPTHTLSLAGFRPPSLNRLLRMHWAARLRLGRQVKQLVGLERLAQGLPKAGGRRRVSVLVEVAGPGGLPDPDGTLKLLLDALVACGLLIDDSARWCECAPPAVRRGEATRTVVALEDME